MRATTFAIAAFVLCVSSACTPFPDVNRPFPDVGCGGPSQPCCSTGVCGDGFVCQGEGTAATCVLCGSANAPCCAGDRCDPDAGLTCTARVCGP